MLTQDQLKHLGVIYDFVLNNPFPNFHSEKGRMKNIYLSKQSDTLAHLAIIISCNLSAKMQLLYLDKICEAFDCDGKELYLDHLNTIINFQKGIVSSLPEITQNYEGRSELELFNK